ncbi:MAG: hypothetical protein CFE24_00155 [Flavobacterium sp. BFFFF2]|nr:MAG: hypothetical protein CFE24_00155 [Flavobacterium sp. BFFFF2]
MKSTILFFLAVLGTSLSLNAQTKQDIQEIVKNYDLNKLQQWQQQVGIQQKNLRKKAIEKAKLNHWPLKTIDTSGAITEIMSLTPDGFPIYYQTTNSNAAKSTRTNHLNAGGSLGLSLNGQNMTVRVWDGGTVRKTHNLLSSRVTVVDNPTDNNYVLHSTHVTGTMIASNTTQATKGMAYQASARTFEWTDDLTEAASEAQLGMLVSNHSYGTPITSGTNTIPAWYTGAYTPDARDWDNLAYLSPYYLMVASAGNDGMVNDNANPSAFGYDKLNGNKAAKNNLVVANAEDAFVNSNGKLTSPVQINTSSSQGPADDLRIKPDITGNGTQLTSCGSSSNAATATLTGTSMASPNVAGTLILLQQHQKNLTSSYMRSATLKGLACHTADDGGNPGPDAIYGWGLLNAKKAAETLTGNGLNSWVSEENLLQSQSYSITVKSSGTEPLIASISWTDLPGIANLGDRPENDPTPALINDLDIRVTKNGQTYFPWRLISAADNAVQDQDNNVDNIEQVLINNPGTSEYVITVTHKGNLVGGNQKYSLIVTGVSSSFSIVPTSADLVVCTNDTATFTYNYKQTGTNTTSFSVVGLPTGVATNLSAQSLSANGTITLNISNLSTIQPGEYTVGIQGFNGTEYETRYKTLRIYNNQFLAVQQESPVDHAIGQPTSVVLKWGNYINAESYNIQISDSPQFTSIFSEQTGVIQNLAIFNGLNQETRYYWRVIPVNRCGQGISNNASIRTFDTGIVVCGQTQFAATDFSNASIATVSNSTASVPVTVTGGYTIASMNVHLDITHTYIQDMTISMVGPNAIGAPKVTFFKEACGDNDNIQCVLTDTGSAPACSGIPAISGDTMPYQPLGTLNGLQSDGVWTLNIDDPYNGDGGMVNGFMIDICYVIPSTTLLNHQNTSTSLAVYPNPTKDWIYIQLPENESKIDWKLYDLQGRVLVSGCAEQSGKVVNLSDYSEGIYMLELRSNSTQITKRVVYKK